MSLPTVRTATAMQNAVSAWRKDNLLVGLVPTMGALHEGHLSLVKAARQHADKIIVSIFVNPTQFAPHEDFSAYPRDETSDLHKLEAAGADLVYIPDEKEIYAEGFETDIKPGPAADGLETDFRPHFFGGVVNVVHRLFKQVQPDIAMFGEKDFQQLQVIREMTAAQNMPIEIIGGRVIRDDHGLALASRNAYLSAEELEIARTLNKVIKETAQSGNLETAKKKLLHNGFDKVDYVEKRWNRILAAGWVGKTRLIDNVPMMDRE